MNTTASIADPDSRPDSTACLENGPMRCTIAPRLGGAIVALTCAGIPVLRGAGPLDDVLGSGCFPLVPFANRIGFGRFRFGHRELALPIDPLGAPHALHGHGWRQPWSIEHHDAHRLTLAMDHAPDEWPWPYRAWQHFDLTPDGLSIELTIENGDSASPMPAGLGLHPYFVRTDSSRITATASGTWTNDPTGLADAFQASTRFSGAAVALDELEGLDNFFLSPDPRIVIADDTAVVTLTGEGAGFHLYCPRGEPYFCVEPVSHAPNSFGRGEWRDDEIIAPQAQITRRYRFAVEMRAGPSAGA